MDQAAHAASGVEKLIDTLREQGVRQGQEEAARLVEEAELRADWLLEQAQKEAQQIVSKAKQEADQTLKAGRDALDIAARDLQIEIKERLVRSFSDQVERLIAQQMSRPELIRELVLQIAGSVAEGAGLADKSAFSIKLPANAVGLDQLRQNPQEYREGELSQLTRSLFGEQLRTGVELELTDGSSVRVSLKDQHAEIDLSADAVANLLLKHLQPRFRAMLEGVIR